MALLDRVSTAFAPPNRHVVRSINARTAVPAALSKQTQPRTDIAIHVVEDISVFESDDGQQIWGAGYAPTDEHGIFLREAEHRTSDPRVFYCHVAGVTYRPEALVDKRFAHGSPVKLVPEPDNPHDPNAVGVWDAAGRIQAGYVPAILSEEVADLMRSGTMLVGQVIREFRLGSERGKRLGIHIVLYPAGHITYVVHDG